MADLGIVTDQLKLLDAQGAAKEIMFAKQRWFEYKDKPGQYLTHLLAERTEHRLIKRMEKSDGTWTFNLEDKLKIFSDYYTELYSSSGPRKEAVNEFLNTSTFKRGGSR